MRTHHPGQDVFRAISPQDIAGRPFPAFPPSARLSSTSVAVRLDEEKLEAHAPGSVVVRPGGTPHFHWAKSGQYLTQVTALGPITLEYLDPHDDPRKG